MKKLLPLIMLLFCLPGELFSQEKTYGVKDEGLLNEGKGLGTMVIVPFEDKMYSSDADAPIGRETGLGPGEIMVKFRNALLESLELEMKKDWNLRVLHEATSKDGFPGLEYVHSSLKYQYIPVSEEVLFANDTSLQKRELRKTNKKTKESGVFEGQIVTHSDKQEKYMAALMNNDTLLDYMNGNLESDNYLFLSEFDIRHYISDPDRIASGGLQYELKIHFSCYNASGEALAAGYATTKVEGDNKNIYEIIRKGIPALSEKLSRMIRNFKLERKP